MSVFRYSRWDGTQQLFPFTADDIMEALSDDLLADGDLWNALERIMQWGLDGDDGQRMEGLQQLLEQLRERRQQELNRFDMGSVFDEIKEKLEEVKQLERDGIDRRLQEARQQSAPSGESEPGEGQDPHPSPPQE